MTAAQGRSREGAWIEIIIYISIPAVPAGRSREGAWIEMPLTVLTSVSVIESLP